MEGRKERSEAIDRSCLSAEAGRFFFCVRETRGGGKRDERKVRPWDNWKWSIDRPSTAARRINLKWSRSELFPFYYRGDPRGFAEAARRADDNFKRAAVVNRVIAVCRPALSVCLVTRSFEINRDSRSSISTNAAGGVRARRRGDKSK